MKNKRINHYEDMRDLLAFGEKSSEEDFETEEEPSELEEEE